MKMIKKIWNNSKVNAMKEVEKRIYNIRQKQKNYGICPLILLFWKYVAGL